ncbi:MAG: hypothetical protein DI597_01260 [Pseudoxanthomonas spadix]|nr:MAG: hypothetical protein DI597_01260 [Pseudoxanthomonas spadix]
MTSFWFGARTGWWFQAHARVSRERGGRRSPQAAAKPPPVVPANAGTQRLPAQRYKHPSPRFRGSTAFLGSAQPRVPSESPTAAAPSA